MDDLIYRVNEIKEDTSLNKRITKEVKDAMETIDKTFSSLFNSINVLEVSEQMFEIVQRIHAINKNIEEIKTLCEEAEKKYRKEDFIERVISDFKDAKDRGFNDIVIAIDDDLDNTYYINDTEEGFQCDLFDYVFDDLYEISSCLYNNIHGNVVDIRIE